MALPPPTCLIVVDLQNGFITPATVGLPATIHGFLEANQFEHRIFTRFINPGENGPFFKILKWQKLQDDNEVALVPQLADMPTLVVDKHNYSPFLDTKLERELREREVREVLVCGISTDICVLTTAVSLFQRGFHPIVAADLCMSQVGTELHEAALTIMARYIGANNIVNSNDLYQGV